MRSILSNSVVKDVVNIDAEKSPNEELDYVTDNDINVGGFAQVLEKPIGEEKRTKHEKASDRIGLRVSLG